ncbi:MAG: arginase family protein [Halolamina sp.]
MRFPGAVAERAAADYAVVGAPLDASTTFQPGARFGPERVRRFARSFDDYDRRTDHHFSASGVHDVGDVRAWNDAAAYLDFLGGSLADLHREGVTPLLLGGEHTVTAAGVRATDPDVLVVLDAHLDLRDAYDEDPWSHAAVTRRALDGDPEDAPLSTVDGTADRAVIIGARTGAKPEWVRAERDDVTVVPPEEVADWSPDLEGESVYLSVDVDAADPAAAPGTGTMEPFGLDPSEMREIVRAVAPHAVGFDAVEVNDRDDGQAAALAGKLLKEFVFAHADA